MHRVVPYAEDSGRNMHRTSIQGDQLKVSLLPVVAVGEIGLRRPFHQPCNQQLAGSVGHAPYLVGMAAEHERLAPICVQMKGTTIWGDWRRLPAQPSVPG